MKFEPFLLEHWLQKAEVPGSPIRWDLASSTGPVLTLRDALALGDGPDAFEELLDIPLTYTPSPGTPALRQAIAEFEGVEPDHVAVVSGAAEGLFVLLLRAAETGANVVLPNPDFPAITAIARGLGLEVRHYRLEREAAFQLDVQQVRLLVDANTRMVVVISPHNPTGAVVDEGTLQELRDFCADRNVPLVCDQVYDPMCYGWRPPRASALPGTIVLGDCSKALCLSGLRVGWIIDRDRARLEACTEARSYLTISNGALGEHLAVLALDNREKILARARDVAGRNRALLEGFIARHADRLAWVRPAGGFTAFPWLRDGSDATPLCQALEARHVLVAPGNCFGAPEHFRLGFGASGAGFADGLREFESCLETFRG